MWLLMVPFAITLKASAIGAFALGKIDGSTVANDKAVGWNWSSGAYNATGISGASTLIIHFSNGQLAFVLQLRILIFIKMAVFFIVQPVMEVVFCRLVRILPPPPESLQTQFAWNPTPGGLYVPILRACPFAMVHWVSRRGQFGYWR